MLIADRYDIRVTFNGLLLFQRISVCILKIYIEITETTVKRVRMIIILTSFKTVTRAYRLKTILPSIIKVLHL